MPWKAGLHRRAFNMRYSLWCAVQQCYMHQLSALSPFWCLRPLTATNPNDPSSASADQALVQANSRHIVYAGMGMGARGHGW